jgi:drug/metabolite transporter (DMT)-like permease
MNIISIVILYAAASGSGLILLKLSLFEKSLDFKNLPVLLFSSKFLVGFFLYALGFVTWIFILSKFKLNFAFPIALSLFFIVITLGSYHILQEAFSPLQIAGTLLCFLGIILISFS